jgi:phosphate transport system protein
MDRHLDDELKKLSADLLTMATMVEESIHKSIEALTRRDRNIADQAIQNDERIDDLEVKIEEAAVEMLALFQPMAVDLRFITTGIKVNMELERIADLAVNISQRAKDLTDQPSLKPLINIPKLAENAKKMVRNSIDAFINKDEELAKSVIMAEQTSDDLRNTIMNELVYDYMVKDGSVSPRAVSLLLVARDLERICDHTVAIAEDVIYMIKAKVVRHHLEDLL